MNADGMSDSAETPGVLSAEKANHGSYTLLNDEPSDDSGGLLGTENAAEGIASIIMASMARSPFVLAIDAGWAWARAPCFARLSLSSLANRA